MRARPPIADIAIITAQIEATPGIDRLRTLTGGFAAATPETIVAVLGEAARFADTQLVPLNENADAQGCRLIDGRVVTAPGHRAAWDSFVAGGWGTLDTAEEWGGQGLPLVLAAAVQEVFDRACPAFGMLPVPQRSAAKLIAAHADEKTKAEWLPRLVTAEWGATICISEVEAGSDAARIRTRAEPDGAGGWRVTGEKCWISYGDHDLTPRIGHCLLARTPGAAPGGAGLSLFLVPDTLDDGQRNAIHVRRIEDKMGLHGSPTCALGFEGAHATMLGVEGRGLAQMFVMITNMRLSTGVEGLGIASAAADVALGYAHERRQGGPTDAPVPIASHADIQRQLLGMAARAAVLRGLALVLAVQSDCAAHEADPDARADAAALVQWLLPIVKTTGGEYATEVTDAAMQVLGGAGYTRDWPVEQGYRDARVLTILEGTTGIQALDLLHRRLLRGDRRGYATFLRMARADAGEAWFLDTFERTATTLTGMAGSALDAGATAFLHLAALAATGWIATRLVLSEDVRLAEAGRFWLVDIDDRATLLAAQAVRGANHLRAFAAFTG